MLIKNCIILVDEIDKRLSEGEASLATLEIASLSRLRPVMLAALTTIFGMSRFDRCFSRDGSFYHERPRICHYTYFVRSPCFL